MANDIADLLLKIDATTEGLRREIKRAESSVEGGRKQIDANTKKIDKSFTSMGDTVKKVAGVIVAAIGAMQIGRKFADVVTETERLRGSLTTITGSADGAAMAFNKLTQFASQTPFTLDKSVNAFIKLKALGLDPSERALLSYGNTASAMGKDMMQMIEAVADASTMEFERLKEFGIKARQQADTVSFTFQGVTTTVAKNSEEIQEYLLAIGETQFAGAMEDQMQRLPGLLSNLQDNVDGLFRKIGDTGGITLFGSAITAVSGAMLYLTDNLDTVMSALSYAGATLTGPLVIGAFALATKAVIALNAAMLANPALLISAAVSAAAYAIYRNWDTVRQSAERAAISIQIAWNELKIFLLQSFAPALTVIRDGFNEIRYRAIATWNGIAAAAANPLNALAAFSEAFDSTILMLQEGESGVNVFSIAIDNAKGEIVNLKDRLVETEDTVISADGAITEVTGSLSDFKTVVDESAQSTSGLKDKTQEMITGLRQQQAALVLSAREQTIYNAVMGLGTDATSEQITEVALLTGEIYDQQAAIGFWTAAAKNGASERAKAEEDAARAMQENWQRTHEYLSASFVDIFDNGKDAFGKIEDSFKAMIKRMVAEWAASKLMNLFGIGSGSGGTATSFFDSITGGGGGGGGSAAGNIAGSVAQDTIIDAISSSKAMTAVKSALGIGGGTVAAGTAVGGTAGVSTVYAAGTSSTAGITSSAIGGGSAAAGGTAGGGGFFSSAGGWIAANPVLAGLAAAAVVAALLAKKSTPSTNAGMLVGPAPGVSADRKFAVDAFASGFQPTGFARREDQSAAMDVISAFAAVDATLTEAIRSAGGYIDMSAATLAGFDEKGQGTGVFMGMASEKGKGVTSMDMEAQLARYANDVMRHASGLTEEQKSAIFDGSHRDGLARVPFDGYRAQLHRNEEVLTSSDPRNQNNGGMADAFVAMQRELVRIGQQTKRTSDILLRVTRDGNALLTEAV